LYFVICNNVISIKFTLTIKRTDAESN